MNTTVSRYVVVLISCVLLCAAAATAEVSISVTLTGTVDEMLPILQHLKDMGVGAGGGALEGEALKMEVHSVAPAAPEPAPELVSAPAAEVPAPPAKPPLALTALAVTPATPKAGDKVLITIQVSDPDHKVDTLAGVVPEWKATIDLFDNGTRGDAVARDGVWSAEVTVPATAAAGECTVHVSAYNVNGEAVVAVGQDGSAAPLALVGKVMIVK